MRVSSTLFTLCLWYLDARVYVTVSYYLDVNVQTTGRLLWRLGLDPGCRGKPIVLN